MGEIRCKSIDTAYPHALLVLGGSGKEGREFPGVSVEYFESSINEGFALDDLVAFVGRPG